MHTPPTAETLEKRERQYQLAYLEYWRKPFDWSEEGLRSPVSTFAPVREWLASLEQGLNVWALRRAMREVAKRHKDGPPLAPIRGAYFAALAEAKQERLQEQIRTGACVYCGNSGRVYVAAWSDGTRTRVIAPAQPPRGVPGKAVHELGVACTCVAGDEFAREHHWTDETRRRFVRHAVSRTQFLQVREACAAMAQDGAAHEAAQEQEAERELF